MCSAPKPPDPVAPPAPIPVREEQIAGREKAQNEVRRGAAAGYASTLLSNGKPGEGGTSPVLGGN